MNSYEMLVPADPVHVAEPFAYRLILDGTFDDFTRHRNEDYLLGMLNSSLRAYEMSGEYHHVTTIG
jgi:hypothetical protein